MVQLLGLVELLVGNLPVPSPQGTWLDLTSETYTVNTHLKGIQDGALISVKCISPSYQLSRTH